MSETQIRVVPLGVGGYLPEKVLSNHDLGLSLDTSDEWITERTGIRQRHIAGDDQLTSDLAVFACLDALEMAGLTAADIDLIVLATATGDETFPATATKVQAKLGAKNAVAFDVAAVCSGFIFALTTANALLVAGQAKTALVIGAETFSRILDWQDRTTAVLFGDGAGAVILQAQEFSDAIDAMNPADSGILASLIRSDGDLHDLLYVDGGPSSSKNVGVLKMAGREVFRHAVVNLSEIVTQVCQKAGVTLDDVDWVVPHQANIRILEAVAKRLGCDSNKIITTVDKHANTSAASIPLALNDAVRAGKINKGDLICFEALGGGLTWGATVMRW